MVGVQCLEMGAPITAAALTNFVVDTITDALDSNLGDGICSNGVDGCSLRAAIEQGFSASPPVTITFWSSLAGSTITLSPAFGPIVWSGNSIIVDGTTNNITISGAGLGVGQSGFRIQGNNNTLRNLTLRNAPQDAVQIGDFAGVGAGNTNLVENLTIIGSGNAGVYVSGSSSSGGQNNTIRGSFIGSSNLSAACVSGEANGYGVQVANGAIGTKIGDVGSANTIVCNTQSGVQIVGLGGSYNTEVKSNHIGTNGTAARGNGTAGVYNERAGGTLIRNNVVSGNGWAGIWINNSADVTLAGNRIGTNSAGTAAIPNGHDGIALTDGTTNATVGGSVLADRNVISGNTFCGVRLRDGSHLNRLDFNLIGLNAAGTTALPNGEAGVAVFNSNDNSIGTSLAGVSQYISGNTREGVYIENSFRNFVGQKSLIGVAGDNTTPRGNGLQGVMLNGATNSIVVAGLIAYNGGAGVAVLGDTATANRVYPIEIRANGGLPIDLGNDGFTPNGARTPPGPNNWINYPVITGGSGSAVSGTACANCTVYILRAIGNPAAPGGGGIYLTEVTADGSGHWNAALTGGVTSKDVSLGACQFPCDLTGGNTSEMSPRWLLSLPLILKN